MVSISHWGMFRLDSYDENIDLQHCGTKYAYLEVIDNLLIEDYLASDRSF